MSFTTQSSEEIHSVSPLSVPEGARILIVSEDNSETEWLKTIFHEEGYLLECAKSISEGCEAAKSAQFQVVVSTPLLKDGSWRRLRDVANHYDLKFEIVLWARSFDLHEWAAALNEGAFDVVDAVYDQPKIVEATKSALWAAYLKGAGPNLRTISSQRAA